MVTSLEVINARVIQCRQRSRLVEHREAIARIKRRQFRDWTYWGLGAVRYFWPAIILRNVLFLVVVLLHGFRRLVPV